MLERIPENIGWLIVVALIAVVIYVMFRRKGKANKLQLTFFINNFKIKGENMALTMTSTQQATGQVQPVDSKGNPAQVEAGTVEYEVTNNDPNDPNDLVEVIEDPDDETKFTIKALGPVGVAKLTIKADADLGEGVKSIETFAAIEITPAGAVGFGVTFGTPEEQPAEGGGGEV